MSGTTVAEIFETMTYGPAPEAAEPARAWLESALNPQGFNQGYNSGQAREHLRGHVIPRWSGDANFLPLIGEVNLLADSLSGTRARLLEARARMEEGAQDRRS